jgi:hypothetical protein
VTTTAPRPGAGRDDWLDEGLRLVASLGAPALTLDRICERMALTKGAFYHHFGSVPKVPYGAARLVRAAPHGRLPLIIIR